MLLRMSNKFVVQLAHSAKGKPERLHEGLRTKQGAMPYSRTRTTPRAAFIIPRMRLGWCYTHKLIVVFP